jgi:hypothetical protein
MDVPLLWPLPCAPLLIISPPLRSVYPLQPHHHHHHPNHHHDLDLEPKIATVLPAGRKHATRDTSSGKKINNKPQGDGPPAFSKVDPELDLLQ